MRATNPHNMGVMRKYSAKTMRKMYDDFEKSLFERSFNRNLFAVRDNKFVEICMISLFHYKKFSGECVDFNLSTSWKDFKEYCEENRSETSELYKQLAEGYLIPEDDFKLSDNSITMSDNGVKVSLKELMSDEFYMTAYAWATVLNIGLALGSDFGLGILKSVSERFIENCDISEKDFREFSIATRFGVADNAFTFKGAMFEKYKLDMPLFGMLSILYDCGICGKALYGLILIAIRKGCKKGILKTMVEYIAYLPACILRTLDIVMRDTFLDKREEMYSKFGVFDTSMYALSKGITMLASLCNVVLLSDRFEPINFIGDLPDMHIKMFKSASDKLNSENERLTDTFIKWLVVKDKSSLVAREFPMWVFKFSVDKSEDKDNTFMATPLIMDCLLSANLDDNKFFDRFEIVPEGESLEHSLGTSLGYPYENVHYVRIDAIASIDVITAAYSYVVDKDDITKMKTDLISLKNRISSLEGQLDKSKNKVKVLAESKKDLKAEIEEVRKSVADKVAVETSKYELQAMELQEKISSLESMLDDSSRKLMEKTQECSKLRKQVRNTSSTTTVNEELPNEELSKEPDVSFEDKVAFLNKFTFVVAGGEANFDNHLRAQGVSNFYFFRDFSDKRQKLKFDYIVICARKCAHKLMYWAQALDRSNNRTLYFNGTGAKAFIEQMYDELK